MPAKRGSCGKCTIRGFSVQSKPFYPGAVRYLDRAEEQDVALRNDFRKEFANIPPEHKLAAILDYHDAVAPLEKTAGWWRLPSN